MQAKKTLRVYVCVPFMAYHLGSYHFHRQLPEGKTSQCKKGCELISLT